MSRTSGEDETARLAREVSAALEAGDRDTALRLTRILEAALTSRGEASRARSNEEVLAFAAPPSVVPVGRTAQPVGGARRVVVSGLAEIGVPSRARLVSEYGEARFGERVDPRTFAGLRRDEHRAWAKKAPRANYVVPALEGRFYQAIRGLLALSDWPLERRLIGPWSERADHLAATAQLARLLAWLNDRDPAVGKRLAPLVAAMAHSIPGALDGKEVDTARVEAAAEAERDALTVHDEPWRREAASRAREQLSDEQQLWGASVGVLAEGDR